MSHFSVFYEQLICCVYEILSRTQKLIPCYISLRLEVVLVYYCHFVFTNVTKLIIPAETNLKYCDRYLSFSRLSYICSC
jgi:hypothetical protein